MVNGQAALYFELGINAFARLRQNVGRNIRRHNVKLPSGQLG